MTPAARGDAHPGPGQDPAGPGRDGDRLGQDSVKSAAGPAGRDRDAAGRPRNARPRDALGRPLPPGAAGEERIPDDLSLRPADALALAQGLLDTGRPFPAHEVLEASWKQAPQPERELWRGLAQIAVGLTHAQRGNPRGAITLLRRGAERVSQYRGRAPHGIDARGVAQAGLELADRIANSGLDGIAGPDLRIRLTGG
jgi:hypothetical protein